MSEIFLYNHNIHKTPEYNIWLGFPGPESFALSTLGYLWMYKSIDELNDIYVERIYSDTVKTIIPSNNVNLMAFSISFDMDIFNVLNMLKKYNINLLSKERDENDPIIFAGGPVVTANPEPYKDFFDFFIIGDGDNLIFDVIKICKDCCKHLSKKELAL